MICMKILFGEGRAGICRCLGYVRKRLSVKLNSCLSSFFQNDLNCECKMSLTSVLGPTLVYYCVIKLLVVVIGKGGAGMLWSTLFTKYGWNSGFLIFRGLWFSWKPTFYYLCSLKVTTLAKSHMDSFSWPERHCLQEFSFIWWGREMRVFVIPFRTLCFRWCLGYVS